MTKSIREQIVSQKLKPKDWKWGDYVYWLNTGSMITEVIGQSIGGKYDSDAGKTLYFAFVQNLTIGRKHTYDFVEIPHYAKRLPIWKGDWNRKDGWFEAFKDEMVRYKKEKA